MAKLPVLKRLSPEDFKELPRKFLDAINAFFEPAYTALNGNLTFSENISGQISVITLPKNTTVSTSSPLKFLWNKPLPPVAVWVGGVRNRDSDAVVGSAAIQVEWRYDSSNKQINIVKIHGISLPDASYHYILTLVGITQ